MKLRIKLQRGTQLNEIGLLFKLQIKRWWGWETLDDYLSWDEANNKKVWFERHPETL